METDDINWIEKPIIGQALIIFASPNDESPITSKGEAIKPFSFYRVGKHKTNGKVAIIEI